MEAVVPLLVSEGIAFKFLVDETMLDLQNSSNSPADSCGKFITVYPASLDQFIRMSGRLHEATRGFEGPYILSDRRYKDSKVLFYRYGAFRPQYMVNVYGEREFCFQGADGRQIQDVRVPYFVLPEGVRDPFPDDEEPAAPVLKGRYQALAALGSSSKGGVYKCLDLQTGMEVVVKEARPLINRGRHNPHDAVACLNNERRILDLLEGTSVTPRLLDLFQEWEHSFLVMSLASGKPLSYHLSHGSLCILLVTEPSHNDVREYCETFLLIARLTLAGLRAIHARGVLHARI